MPPLSHIQCFKDVVKVILLLENKKTAPGLQL